MTKITQDIVEKALLEDMMNDLPGDLEELSSHTFIEDVEVYSFSVMSVTRDDFKVVGDGSVQTDLQYGSEYEIRHDDGEVINKTIPFKFEAHLDKNGQAAERSYTFDLEDF